ncbi:MAG: molybdopterin biosynthesis protein [Fervidicoccus fontis]|uniref:Molybdopterin biosynthesis protein n=2 Tax=Fervidicoccus fontis TaxID=683846 RepID=A0A2J6N7E2_9CREN|nr:MAG: molybdopterin biosynthesis protein [Fervidicoccus fontis]PMB77136.1 MAG: molybdopterin biosynthesis protein [Fervidicoccus fontis]HEW64318.1 molybdopterin biosynthesis protein [Fervidicoccus fontis]
MKMEKRKLFHRLVSVEEGLEVLEEEQLLNPLGIEEVNLQKALYRVLADDIYAPIDYPPFDRSEVDGYAVNIKSVENADELNPAVLKIAGKVRIGEFPKIEVDEKNAVEIDTGAMIPRGTSGIVMEEYTKRKENEYVEVYRSVYTGENISFAGSDIAKGELLFSRGRVLDHIDIGILSSMGINKVKVYIEPKIAILSTGNELVPPGSDLSIGKIYDVNAYMIYSLLKAHGIESDMFGIVQDKEDILEERIRELLKSYDIIITSGGTSAGIDDVVYRVFDRVGEVLIHGFKLKPGKPTVLARSGRKLLIGLPGFPFSSLANSLLILLPALFKIRGTEYRAKTKKASIAVSFRKDIGRRWLVPVLLNSIDKKIYAIPFSTSSGSIMMVARADGIALLSENKDVIEEGSEVDVVVFNSFEDKEGIIMGSHDLMLPDILKESRLEAKLSYIPVGSYLGLELVKRGFIDIAPIHLFDENTGTYNAPFLNKDPVLKSSALLVRGYSRKLVLAFREGTNLRGLEDVLESGLRFANRNKGSGTRMYVDYLLKRISAEKGVDFKKITRELKGYEYNLPSHNSVAAAISQGRADAGVCIEHAARIYGLRYIPLAEEHYDFAVNRKSLEKNAVKTFIDSLEFNKIKKIAERYFGYIADSNAGKVICC